jgi:Fic family protein
VSKHVPQIDFEYDENIRRISALISDSEARIACQTQRIEQITLIGGPVEGARSTLDLMLEMLETMRLMRNGYVTFFRGRLH